MARRTRLLATAALALLVAASASAQDQRRPEPAPEPATEPAPEAAPQRASSDPAAQPAFRRAFDAGVAQIRERDQDRLGEAVRESLRDQFVQAAGQDQAEFDRAPDLVQAATPAGAAFQPGTTPQRRDPTPSDPVVYPVDWGQAAEDRQREQAANQGNFTTAAFTPAAFPRPDNADQAGGAAETRLPVLLPTETALGMGDPQFLLFPSEHHYTASFTGNGLLVEVFGTSRAHARAPDPLAARRLRAGDGDGFIVVATEYGQELTFNRYGAAYSVTVECEAPQSDPRCTSEDYVRNLGRSLQIAAGSPEGG